MEIKQRRSTSKLANYPSGAPKVQVRKFAHLKTQSEVAAQLGVSRAATPTLCLGGVILTIFSGSQIFAS